MQQIVLKNSNAILAKDGTLVAKLQYKCTDPSFIQPVVERLLFPSGRKEVVSDAEMQKLIDDYKETLQKKVGVDVAFNYSDKCRLLAILDYNKEKTLVELELKVKYRECLFNRVRNAKYQLNFYTCADKLTIQPQFEKDGFDIVFHVTYGSRWASMDYKPESKNLSETLVNACNAILNEFRSVAKKNELELTTRDVDICVLLVTGLEEHMPIVRYIRSQANLKASGIKCVVIVKDFANPVLTWKEMTSVFESQNILLLKAEDYM